jgi:hypothetical protein
MPEYEPLALICGLAVPGTALDGPDRRIRQKYLLGDAGGTADSGVEADGVDRGDVVFVLLVVR